MRHLPAAIAVTVFLAAAVYSYISLHRAASISVLIVTVESLRDDAVTIENTPSLLKIAEQGTRFTNHRAVSGWTGTNVVSLLTGLTPFESGVHTRGRSISPHKNLPLYILQRSGYQVEGIQGFMLMDIYRNMGLTILTEVRDLQQWLSAKVISHKPFLGWYHYVDTHLPYTTVTDYPTEASRALSGGSYSADQSERLALVQSNYAIHHDEARFERKDVQAVHDLQSSTIREFDAWFAQFWDFFNETGLRRRTILVLTADHGDEHGERGLVGHASTTLRGHLHEEIVRVPLFVWLPEHFSHNSTEAQIDLVSTHEDVMPTILALLRKSAEFNFKGRNLFKSRIDSSWRGMTSSGGFAEPDPHDVNYFEYGILSGTWKLRLRIDRDAHKTFFLHNLKSDRDEVFNLSEEHPDVVDELYTRIQPYIDSQTVLEPAVVATRYVVYEDDSGPVWIHPAVSRTVSYDDMQGKFMLEWHGPADHKYVIEYAAGEDQKQIKGFLNVHGAGKDFGDISKRYWDTWVVPNSPYRLRVRKQGSDQWSRWLELQAVP